MVKMEDGEGQGRGGGRNSYAYKIVSWKIRITKIYNRKWLSSKNQETINGGKDEGKMIFVHTVSWNAN